jgi:peroxiredoxin
MIDPQLPTAVRPLLLALLLAPMPGLEAQDTELLWWDGQALAGALTSADGSQLGWRSELFEDELKLGYEQIYQVSMPGEMVLAKESLLINLHDGSRLFGDIAGLADGILTLKGERFGELSVGLASVRSVHRVQGGGVIWSGPVGIVGWKFDNSADTPAWGASPEGGFESIRPGELALLPLDFKGMVQVELELESSDLPEFELTLVAGERWIQITTWDNELVATRGGYFVPLKTIEGKDSKLSLLIYWNSETGEGSVAERGGRVLGTWTTGEASGDLVGEGATPLPGSKPDGQRYKDGLSLVNRGVDMTVGTLRVRGWDGGGPEGQPRLEERQVLEGAGVELSDGQTRAGLPVRIEGKRVWFEGEEQGSGIELDKILTLWVSDPHGEITELEPVLNLVEIRFEESTVLYGELQELGGDGFRIEGSSGDWSAVVKSEGLRQVRWLTPPAERPASLDGLDLLEHTNGTIRGLWEPAESDRVMWRLPGAVAPVAVKSSPALRLTRATPEGGEWVQAPSLFLLRGGLIAPGELDSVERDGRIVRVKSEVFSADQLEGDQIEAILLSAPEIEREGFLDPGWTYGRSEEGKRGGAIGEDGKVVIEPGQALGHPSILFGGELSFVMESRSSGGLNLRMFTNLSEAEAPATNLIIAHWGNEVYSGLGDGQGNFRQRHQQTPVEANQPVRVRLAWDEASTTVYINDQLAGTVEVDENAPRSGHGFQLSSGRLWGNQPQRVSVSEFSVDAEPGFTWVPGINQKAKEQVLFLPRFRKADPPRHVLVAHNGDLLRGTIESAAEGKFRFRSGLDVFSLPVERAAAVVWLPMPEGFEPIKRGPAGSADIGEEIVEVQAEPVPPPTHWITLRDGGRIALAVESFGEEAILGKSETLGDCRLSVELVHRIEVDEPPPAPAALALSGWELVPALEPKPGRSAADPALLGREAPAFDLPLLGGGQIELESLRGKVVVLEFWASWSSSCARAMPELIEALSGFKGDEVALVAVNQAEPPEVISNFLEVREWELPIVALDANQTVGLSYSVEGVPHTVLIDQQGNIVWSATGYVPGGAEEVAEAIRELLK